MIKPDKRAEYYHKKSHMEHNLQRVILEDGVAYIPCRIDGLSDIVSKFSIEGAESLDGEFVDYVLDFVDIIPVEYPVILEIYGPNFPEETKQFITELIKVEGGYFVHIIGPDGFEQWAAERKTQMIDRLSEEDLERVTSFLNDAKGEEYERDSALFGQLWFNAAHFRMADEQVNGGGKSYIYYFTPESTVPYIKSGHATEIAGIFNHPDDTVLTGRTFDETFSGIMRKMWIQFAKIGNPSLSADISPD